jgi:hypothetical protein
MTSSDQITDGKYAFLKSMLCAIFVGSFIGIFDLWAFQPSMKLFLAGQAAGITFCSIFFFLNYFMRHRKTILLITVTAFSGISAGLIWWLIAGSAIPLWLAIVIGGCLPNLLIWIDSGFKLQTD